MSRTLPVFAACGAGSVLFGLLLSSRPQPQQTAREPSVALDPALRGRVATLERRLGSLSEDIGALEEEHEDLIDLVTQDPVEPAPAADQPPPERPGPTIAQISRGFDGEQRDASWAEGAETAILASVRQQLPELHLLDLECRGDLCAARVQLPEDPIAANDVSRRLSFALPWSGEAVSGPDPDDPGVTVFFVAREGYGMRTAG